MDEQADDRPGFQVDRPTLTGRTCPCTVASEAPREIRTAAGATVRQVYAMAGGRWRDQVTLYGQRVIEPSGLDDVDVDPRVECDVLGSLRDLHREADALIGTAHFSLGRAGAALWADVDGGHAVGIILRTSIYDYRTIQPGDAIEFDGRMYRADDALLQLVTDWQAWHAFAVPAGTDDVGQFNECARGYFDAWVSALPACDPLTPGTRELLIERGMPREFNDVAALRWAKRNLVPREAAETGPVSPLVWDYQI